MAEKYIVLKNIGEAVNPIGSALIHEVAHALHHEIDIYDNGMFSKKWFEKHSPPPRRTDERGQPILWQSQNLNDLKQSGSLSSYANYDVEIDPEIKVTYSGKKTACLSKNNLTLFYEPADLNNAVSADQIIGTLLRDKSYLPERMAPFLRVVILDPYASHPTFNSSSLSIVNPWHSRISENIAMHTEQFTIAALYPFSNKKNINRIREEPKLQAKVEDLARQGFIADDTANFLLDSQASTKAYCRAERKKLPYPPFVGIIPEELTAAEIALMDCRFIADEVTAGNLLVSSWQFQGRTYYSTSRLGFTAESQLAPQLRDFILNRSDLGILCCFVGKHHLFRDENIETVWLSGSGIKSADEFISLERLLKQKFKAFKTQG
ncbi:hypothetical protein J4479_04695 [Candidatus Woesearchaeota archaeon]|nr:hypothetical protein [Candidatus Woesearchaeota archaeon]